MRFAIHRNATKAQEFFQTNGKHRAFDGQNITHSSLPVLYPHYKVTCTSFFSAQVLPRGCSPELQDPPQSASTHNRKWTRHSVQPLLTHSSLPTTTKWLASLPMLQTDMHIWCWRATFLRQGTAAAGGLGRCRGPPWFAIASSSDMSWIHLNTVGHISICTN